MTRVDDQPSALIAGQEHTHAVKRRRPTALDEHIEGEDAVGGAEIARDLKEPPPTRPSCQAIVLNPRELAAPPVTTPGRGSGVGVR